MLSSGFHGNRHKLMLVCWCSEPQARLNFTHRRSTPSWVPLSSRSLGLRKEPSYESMVHVMLTEVLMNPLIVILVSCVSGVLCQCHREHAAVGVPTRVPPIELELECECRNHTVSCKDMHGCSVWTTTPHSYHHIHIQLYTTSTHHLHIRMYIYTASACRVQCSLLIIHAYVYN